MTWVDGMLALAVTSGAVLLVVGYVRRRFRAARGTAGDQAAAVEQAVAVVRRQRDEYRSTIESVLAERDRWKQLYYQQAVEHGAAQALLFRNLERYHRYTVNLRAVVATAGDLASAQAAAQRPPDVDVTTIGRIVSEFHGMHAAQVPPGTRGDRAG